MAIEIDRDALAQLLDAAASAGNVDLVDLAKLLGLSGTLRVGVDDLGEVLMGAPPTVHVDIGDATVTVSRQDGGVMGTLAIRF